ncbi:ABC transporter ATP-binding protein [Streptomyces sp. NPDC002932]|uniref:ABC transporter ATP-binding protein n=1 Tax=Streptomyces sp. NPDC002932 TaxID=3364672 RepID=UPI0036BB7874
MTAPAANPVTGHRQGAPGADRAVPLLEVHGIAKSYGSGNTVRQVLGGIHFDVQEREFVTVVGPSGAGKTTLLRCLAGLLAPDSGEVRLAGAPVHAPPEGLALVFQDYSRSLLPWMSVLDNIQLPLRRRGTSPAERQAAAQEALSAVGLADAGRLYPWQMSGGMQQRAAIARALACTPRVLVMDEPFASVDAQTRADLEDLTLRLQRQRGMTVVLVTHDMDEAVYLADRVVVLSGAPTTVSEIVPVDLGTEREQLATKLMPAFAELRAHVLGLVRRPAPAQ